MKVLIVDDNDEIRYILRQSLEFYCAATVLEGCDGLEGLNLARTQHPDLIISDAMMPRLDGFQFLHQLKADEALKDIPFVFYSSIYTGSRDAELAISLGAEAFIAKPKDPEEFILDLNPIIMRLKTGGEGCATPVQLAEEEDYLREYSGVVAAKLELKVRELEDALEKREKAEEALRAQFTHFNTIFEALNALVYVADLKSDEILFMNRYGNALFSDDWEGKTCAQVFQQQAGDYWGQRSNGLLVRDGVPQSPCVFEFHSQVSGRWYQGIDHAILWSKGQLARLQIAFDITERKELGRIKDEMLSAVSHEMRTPLTALLGYTEFMLSNELPRRQAKEHLRVVHQEAEKLNGLIGNFLDTQRQRAGGMAFAFCPISLCPLIEEIAATFTSSAPTHRIITACPADLPSVLGDEISLQHMLEMLVTNAIKFSPAGGEVRLNASLAPGGIQIEVSDQGIGIQAEELDHIFELFYRVDNTDRRTFGGTGLGLALVREIALGHNGQTWGESRVGQGSSFYVFLPTPAKTPE